jgi:chromosome partitioning protein
MKLVAVLGEKGGTTKTATAHLLCLGAYLHGVAAAYVLTDPKRKIRGEGRPYAVLDGRLPEQLAVILQSSASNLNGWLIIDGGGNRPDFDAEVSKHVDMTIVPFRNSEEDLDPTANSLSAMPKALA